MKRHILHTTLPLFLLFLALYAVIGVQPLWRPLLIGIIVIAFREHALWEKR
jgi:hypothetical protein